MDSSQHAPRIGQVLDFGVEEEFLLVDRTSRAPVPRAEQVYADASAALGERVQREFYRSQIEVNSRPSMSAAELRSDLVQARRLAAAAARRADCLLLATGTAIVGSEQPVVTEDPRFAAMVDKYAFIQDITSESNACHIHLGRLDRGEALHLSNRIRCWLPVLQAVASNSPFAAGQDLGYGSSRFFFQGRWPTVGPTPVFAGAEHYEEIADRLVSSGEILDRKMIYWFARPSEHLPTLEIRVADVNADVDVTLLVVILARALGTTLLAELREERPYQPVGDERLLEAHRQAALHGLGGKWFDPMARRMATLEEGLASLVERAGPGLDAAGDTALAHRLVARVLRLGTGAERQRADFRERRSLVDVADRVAATTVAG